MATIDKLQSLYRQLDSQESAGEDVVADLRKEINNLELAYLKEEVFPQVVSILGSKIKNLRCGLDCSIQFNDEGIVNYSFCTSNSMLLIKDSFDVKTCIESNLAPKSQTACFEYEIEYNQSNNRRTELSDKFKGFRNYLHTLTSLSGKPYSESSINLYANLLRSGYLRGVVSQYILNENIEDISSIDTLNEIYKKVETDSRLGLTNPAIGNAVKLYLKYRSSENSSVFSPFASPTFIKSNSTSSTNSSSNKARALPIEICSINADHIHITEGKPTSMFVQFLNEIGAELVYDMHIRYLGGDLVSKEPNPKYITASKKLKNGYWVNVNSSTKTKIEQIKLICSNLGMNAEIVTGNGDEPKEQSDSALSNARPMFSLNGNSPLNKRRSVLECVRLFMKLNPNVPFEVVERNFPPELQGSYGVVAKLEKVNSRIMQGYDDYRRYFLTTDDVLKAKDGVEFVVCHEWGNQFYQFQKYIKKRFGWNLEQVN